LDGSAVILKRSAVTPAGYIQQLNNQGMPIHRTPTKRGKLFVEYSVIFPAGRTFSDAEKDQLKKLVGGPTSSPIAGGSGIKDEL
jgi:DnaJ-related protein SCJ1